MYIGAHMHFTIQHICMAAHIQKTPRVTQNTTLHTTFTHNTDGKIAAHNAMPLLGVLHGHGNPPPLPAVQLGGLQAPRHVLTTVC